MENSQEIETFQKHSKSVKEVQATILYKGKLSEMKDDKKIPVYFNLASQGH